ncbi:MAG: ribulose-phosphate 3-epimerase [Firmicutes bacterium]|nr:ribulose-phosphate 3-epimerase [Bacillota bacterium]
MIKRRISTSILAADFSKLEQELRRVSASDLLHLDVMDGIFVPNISFGIPVIEAVSSVSQLPLDIHLMIREPSRFIGDFARFKPEFITVHYESVTHLQRVLRQIKDLGIKTGLALNPHTPLEGLRYVLDDLDLVLLMTVNPGYGGQKFIPAMVQKIKECSRILEGRPIELQVDGGISIDNVAALAQAGANNFVAGSAIFQAAEPNLYIEEMRSVKSAS